MKKKTAILLIAIALIAGAIYYLESMKVEPIINSQNTPQTSIELKDDKSPLTLADRISHETIVEQLTQSFPNIPVLSEEGSVQYSFEERKKWSEYFLVDPLDGTKEYIKRNGEFTVNIAFIENRRPTIGVIHIPVQSVSYYGDGDTAFKSDRQSGPVVVRVNNKTRDRVAVRSRSHASQEEENVLKQFGVVDFISVGSSIKFCMVAEGKADIYYRHGPTMEWDTAAGQAIVQAAGGNVFSGSSTIDPFTYNKENLLNGSFLCVGFNN